MIYLLILSLLLSFSTGFEFGPAAQFLETQSDVISANCSGASSESDGNGTWITAFLSNYPSSNIHLSRYDYSALNWKYLGIPLDQYYTNNTNTFYFDEPNVALCGNVWMMVFSYIEDNPGGSGGHNNYIYYSTSADGVTWTEPLILHSVFLSPEFYLRFHSGFALKCNPSTKDFLFSWKSYGDASYIYYSWYGSTAEWSEPTQLYSDPNFVYPQADIEPAAGRNWMVTFQCGGSQQICFATIDGTTYLPSEPVIIDLLNCDSTGATPALKSDGSVTLLAWGAKCGNTNVLLLASSRDFGNTWFEPIRVDTTNSYSKITCDDLGNWAVIWAEMAYGVAGQGLWVSTTTTNWKQNVTAQQLTEKIVTYDTELIYDRRGNWAVWWSETIGFTDRHYVLYYSTYRVTEPEDSASGGNSDRTTITAASVISSVAVLATVFA